MRFGVSWPLGRGSILWVRPIAAVAPLCTCCFVSVASERLDGPNAAYVSSETNGSIKSLHFNDRSAESKTCDALSFASDKIDRNNAGSGLILKVSEDEPSAPNDENVLHWDFQNLTGEHIQLQFFSKDRSHVWPGNNQARNLRDDQVQTFNLTCRPSEKICFGARYYDRADRHWGVGRSGDEGSSRCCTNCGETPEQVNLEP